MTERCKPGDWVEIERVLLEPAERAGGLPPDTADTPLVMWAKGFARGEAAIGDTLAVETASGRVIEGRLTEIDPGYSHTFGRPLPEISRIGPELRARLEAYRLAAADRDSES